MQEYQDAVAKLQEDFEAKLRRGQTDLEEAIAKEKAEKEAERAEKELMRQELVSFHLFKLPRALVPLVLVRGVFG